MLSIAASVDGLSELPTVEWWPVGPSVDWLTVAASVDELPVELLMVDWLLDP